MATMTPLAGSRPTSVPYDEVVEKNQSETDGENEGRRDYPQRTSLAFPGMWARRSSPWAR